jgi:S-adenosylmethionine:tRNA-ribosyltransferase-isomerase (queuine synthetase)
MPSITSATSTRPQSSTRPADPGAGSSPSAPRQSACSNRSRRDSEPASGWTELFVYPPYEYRNVDCLLTNFHQPCSSLLALVMAFAGVGFIRTAYKQAIEQRYRLFSYGDAMLIL